MGNRPPVHLQLLCRPIAAGAQELALRPAPVKLQAKVLLRHKVRARWHLSVACFEPSKHADKTVLGLTSCRTTLVASVEARASATGEKRECMDCSQEFLWWRQEQAPGISSHLKERGKQGRCRPSLSMNPLFLLTYKFRRLEGHNHKLTLRWAR